LDIGLDVTQGPQWKTNGSFLIDCCLESITRMLLMHVIVLYF